MVKLRRHTARPTECVSCGRSPGKGDEPSRWKTIRRRGVRGPECPQCFNSHEHQRDDGISDPRQLYERPLPTGERAEPEWVREARQRGEARSVELLAEAGRDAPAVEVLADSGGVRVDLLVASRTGRPTLRVSGCCGLCGAADRPEPRAFPRVTTPALLSGLALDAPRCGRCRDGVDAHRGDAHEFVAAQVGKRVEAVGDGDVWAGDALAAARRGLPVFPNASPWDHASARGAR